MKDDNRLLGLNNYSNKFIKSVRLLSGWEDTDLTKAADLEVELVSGKKINILFVSLSSITEIIENHGYYWQLGMYFVIDKITVDNIRKLFDSDDRYLPWRN